MIYIHVPFCRSFCTYCGFYSEICSDYESYVQELLSEIESRKDEITAFKDNPDTIYFGGGTPSLLPVGALRRVGAALRGLGVTGKDEFTIEVNPDDVVRGGVEYASALVEAGIGRVSMGVQSLDDGILRWMGRRHDAACAREAFRLLRLGGVRNISVDIIFGLPQLSDVQLLDTLEGLLSLGPDHISAYQLSIEEDSALAQMIADGRFAEASDEQCCHQYDLICERLARAGFNHYEISNWARPGAEAVHNSAYWRRLPYVGLGPGAHSFDGAKRRWNTCQLSGYTSEYEILTPREAAEERLMLALRTAEGLPESELRSLASSLRSDAGRTIDTLLSEGALVQTEGRIRILENHFFVSDDIVSGLI